MIEKIESEDRLFAPVGVGGIKGVLFSESVWIGDVFHCKTSGKGFKYTRLERVHVYLERGVVNYLSLKFYFRNSGHT